MSYIFIHIYWNILIDFYIHVVQVLLVQSSSLFFVRSSGKECGKIGFLVNEEATLILEPIYILYY